jgi:succinate dehydrogenase cytochrome b subunit
MDNAGRPLSPHLTIYRWPITMILSILHRVTGVALSAGLVLLTLWLLAVSFGASAYGLLAGVLQSVVGRLVLAGCSFAFFFHLCNGIRHLFWDIGKGFGMRGVDAVAWLVVVTSLTLTVGFWLALRALGA